MYTIDKIIVRNIRIMETMDVSQDKVKDLLARYTSIRVVLSNPTLDVLSECELQDNDYASNYTGTVEELVRTGLISKMTITEHIDPEGNQCVFKTDLWDRDFDVTPANVLSPHSKDPVDTWPDLKIVNDFLDPTLMARTHLVSVNGLVHPLVSDSDGVYVVGGNVNIRETGDIEMSLIEFRDVGHINYHSLGCNSRIKVHETEDLMGNGLYIKLDEGYRDKVIGLVILGHLHLLDNTYRHFDRDILHVDLKHLDLETKIINHHNALGMESVSKYLSGQLGRVDLRNPSLIDYVLDNKSTFMFTIDTDTLYRHVRPLNDEGLPNVYSTGTLLTGIAQYADGLCADYRQDYQDGLYCINVPKRPSTNLLNKTTNAAQQSANVRGEVLSPNHYAPMLLGLNFYKTV